MKIQSCRTAGSRLVLSGLLVVLGLRFPVSGRPWSEPKNGRDFPRQEKVPIQDDAELVRILEKSAAYCDRLKRSALDFVCRESVKEEGFRYGIGEAHVTTPSPTGDGTRVAYSVPELRKKTQKMSYIYDYQLIKKGDVIIENRTLLEENGKKKEEKQASLKTKKFFSLKPVFGPVGFLAREWQSIYDYKLVKEDTLDGVKAFILEVRPKVLIEGKPNYGKIWVAAQDGSVLRIDIEQESLIGFELIQEHARVRKIIKEMKEVIPGAAESNLATPFNLNLEMQMAEAEKGIENRGSDATPGFARAQGVGANPEAEWKEKKIMDYTVRFQEMAKALRTISGYKNIVFFTNGFPRAYVEGNAVFRSYWEAAGKELASASAPVFSVNALGRRDNFNRSEMRADTSLKMLSDLSGGKYLGDVAEAERIADEIQSATSNYYVLGYPIDRQWDGKFHEVRVEVKPKGYRVHAQGGYFNPKPFNKMSSLEKQIQLIDLALNEKPFDQEPLRFSACALPFSGAGAPNVVVMSEIPPDRFKGELGDRLEYTTLIIDGTNNIVTSERSELDLRRTESSALYGYIVSSLQPGQYNCRIVLRSLETGRAAVASSRVAIPESEETEPGAPFLSLYPPLLLVPNKPAVYLKLSREKNPAPDSPANTLQQIYQFVSNEHTPLVVHLPAGVVKLLAVVRCRAVGFTVSGSGESRVEFTADLMADPAAAKTELSLDILDAKKLEGTDAVLLEVGLPELKSGRYRLEFTAKETSTGRESRTSRNLVVK